MNVLGTAEPLSASELDRRLAEAVEAHERSEKLICIYLSQIQRRRLYTAFGFENVYDYALERFGFCHSKTRTLLYLARRLGQLPKLTEALATGRLGWTKAAKVARVADKETEGEWIDKAVASSFKELEDELRDGVSPGGGRISVWLNAEQMAVWAKALEICRRVSGEQIDPGLALEYIAGEFLATYAAPTEALIDETASASGDSDEAEREPLTEPVESSAAEPSLRELSTPVTAEIDPRVEARLCPDNDDLPSVEAKCYAAIHKAVLDRDGYRCQYPGCSVRHGLHVHHIELRSHFGRKSWAQMNDPSNLIVLCYFHHRMLHAGIIGVKGRAPGELAWRRPEALESTKLSHEELGGLGAPMDDELGLSSPPHPLRPNATVAETITEIAAAVSAAARS